MSCISVILLIRTAVQNDSNKQTAYRTAYTTTYISFTAVTFFGQSTVIFIFITLKISQRPVLSGEISPKYVENNFCDSNACVMLSDDLLC